MALELITSALDRRSGIDRTDDELRDLARADLRNALAELEHVGGLLQDMAHDLGRLAVQQRQAVQGVRGALASIDAATAGAG